MARQGVKRKADLEASLRTSRARVSGLEEELADVKKEVASEVHKLTAVKEELGLTKDLHAVDKNNAFYADHWKRMYDSQFAIAAGAMRELISLRAENLHLKQTQQAACEPFKVSVALAQRELKVCQQQLKQCKGNAARAEKAERKVDSLSAEMSEIEELTDQMRGTLTEGSVTVGGFKGVIAVLRVLRDQLKHDSDDQVIVWHPESAPLKQEPTGEREKVVVPIHIVEEMQEKADEAARELEKEKAAVETLQERVRESEVQKEEAVKQIGELSRRGIELQQKLKDVERERDAAIGESKRLGASLVGTTEQLTGLESKLAEEEKKAVNEAGVLRGQLEEALKQVQAAEEQTGGAFKQLMEEEVKLRVMERERDAALGESEGLRGSLESALEFLQKAERTMKNKEEQLRDARQRELGFLDELAKGKGTIAALQKDVQQAEDQKEAAGQRVMELLQTLVTATQNFREVGKASAKEKENLERELLESKERTLKVETRLQKVLLSRKVVESELEHKNRSIADLTQKNSEKEV